MSETPAPVPVATPLAHVPVRGGVAGAALGWAAVGLVLALWAITGAGRVWRAPPAPFVALVTFLPYLYAVGALFGFGVWSVFPDRRAPPIALALLVASAMALWGPALPTFAAPPAGAPLRAATWNVRRLWGPADALGRPAERRRALACVVEGVEAAKPDVIALLEVSAVDVANLASRLDLSCVHGDYLGTAQDDLGGLAVCTRGDRWSIRAGGPRRFLDDDDWTYAYAEVVDGERVANVFAVHLQPYSFGTMRIRSGLEDGTPGALLALSRHGEAVSRTQGDQAAALLDRMQRLQDPTIVLGDFNSTRDTALHTSLRGVLTDAWEARGRGFGPTVSFLERLPLRVDYVYVTPDIGVVGAEVPARDCSDHRPVVAELRVGG